MRGPKDGLRVRWSKREKDLEFWHDRHPPDGHLLYYFFGCARTGVDHDGKTFAEELEARGFDLTTLRFDIKRKKADL